MAGIKRGSDNDDKRVKSTGTSSHTYLAMQDVCDAESPSLNESLAEMEENCVCVNVSCDVILMIHVVKGSNSAGLLFSGTTARSIKEEDEAIETEITKDTDVLLDAMEMSKISEIDNDETADARCDHGAFNHGGGRGY